MNPLEKKASHQRATYLKYKKLNKAFYKKNTRVVLYYPLDRDSSSSSEADNSPDEDEKTSIAYDSDSGNSDKISNSATNTKEEAWNNGCRYGFIIDKLNNSKSKIKEHKLSSNNLDKALHDAHLLNTLRKQYKNIKRTKSNNKLKYVNFSPIIFVKLVIPAGEKYRQSKTRMVKALVDSGASESIIIKYRAGKMLVKKTQQERQWSTAAGVLTTNTKTGTSFSFPQLYANKLINQSLHIVNLNINRYDMIIGRDLIRSLDIDIHGADMTIHCDDAANPWRDIDSTTNDVFALSHHNSPFNS